MKRYLIEFDEKNIWSYAAADDGGRIKYKLMRPHGDKYCARSEYADYRDWFQEEVGDAEDVCFVYPAGDQKSCEDLISSLEITTRATVSRWTTTELKIFFERDRDDRLTVEFDETARQFFSTDGRRIAIRGAASLELMNDIEENFSEPEPIEEPPPIEEPSPIEEPPISKVKVFAPTEEKISAPIAKFVESEVVVDQKQSRSEGATKITALELQEHIKNRLDGQCETVPIRR